MERHKSTKQIESLSQILAERDKNIEQLTIKINALEVEIEERINFSLKNSSSLKDTETTINSLTEKLRDLETKYRHDIREKDLDIRQLQDQIVGIKASGIENKLKIATIKEEKISSLITKLEHFHVYIYIYIYIGFI